MNDTHNANTQHTETHPHKHDSIRIRICLVLFCVDYYDKIILIQFCLIIVIVINM